MPFSEGKLPIKYLGVPLISSRLLNRDCKILVEKVRNKIGDWKNKSLSFAGKLQLCNSVISSMQVYWAFVLVLPKGIVYDIQQLIRCFLWCNGDFKRRKAKVAWEVISLPKQEGVVDLMRHGAWNWPLSWLAKAPNLSLITALNFDNSHDRIQWHDDNGKMADFSVKLAWEALRLHGDKVSWSNIVWFAHCIPRHAFYLWLVMRRSLKTQDMLRTWDVEPSINLSTLRCVFCKVHMDSHEHLFFECSFSSQVWQLVRVYAEMDTI
ncbi:reverse transcriptase domain, reverse transcriptase zinc-binding domain protein [Tanacetum coccineum]